MVGTSGVMVGTVGASEALPRRGDARGTRSLYGS